MIKSSEKTQSTGNLRFALDAYPKHNVRDDITFFISFFNMEEIWKLLEIVAFFSPWDEQRSLSTNPEDKLLRVHFTI